MVGLGFNIRCAGGRIGHLWIIPENYEDQYKNVLLLNTSVKIDKYLKH